MCIFTYSYMYITIQGYLGISQHNPSHPITIYYIQTTFNNQPSYKDDNVITTLTTRN